MDSGIRLGPSILTSTILSVASPMPKTLEEWSVCNLSSAFLTIKMPCNISAVFSVAEMTHYTLYCYVSAYKMLVPLFLLRIIQSCYLWRVTTVTSPQFTLFIKTNCLHYCSLSLIAHRKSRKMSRIKPDLYFIIERFRHHFTKDKQEKKKGNVETN